jgi:colanic acid/amylovoran biosynthesis glycosyltransferase
MNVVISQALATGLPVIATKHSGLPDQVVDGKNGFLVDEGDFKALAEKILYFINHPHIWPQLSISGRNHVKEKYDTDTLIDEQIRCYEEILRDSHQFSSGK